MDYFLKELSEQYIYDLILLVCDNAGWHKSKSLAVPSNILIMHIPPYTPEMNPIEQIRDEIREKGFANQCFQTLASVVDRLCETMRGLTQDTIKSISFRNSDMFIFYLRMV